MKKIVTEFTVDETNYEDSGMCQIIDFDFPDGSGLSHGQIISVDDIDLDKHVSEHFVMDAMKGKKYRLTLEVIKEG